MIRTFIFALIVLASNISWAQTTIEAYSFQPSTTEPAEKLTVIGNKIYLAAKDATHGRELWSFDGQQAPQRITDTPTGVLDGLLTKSDRSYNFGVVGNRLYYLGNYKDQGNTKTGLYEYDIAGNIATVVNGTIGYIGNYVQHGNNLYFTASSGSTNRGLFKYDVSAKTMTQLLTTNMIGFTNLFGTAIPLLVKGDLLYIGTRINNVSGIYEYDLNTNKEKLIQEVKTGGIERVHDMRFVGNDLYFAASKSGPSAEIYKYDGTNPPQQVSDIVGDGVNTIVSPLTEHNGVFYFMGENVTQNDYEIASFDTKTNKAKLLTNFNGIGLYTTHMVEYNNKIYYTPVSGASDALLYYYDIASGQNVKVDVTIKGSTNEAMPAFAGWLESPRLIKLGNSLVYTAYDTTKKEYLIAKLTDGNLSVYNTSQELTTTLYPNPTSGNATLTLQLDKAQNILVVLTDIAGRVVYTKTAQTYSSGTSNITVPTQNLQTGVYFLQLTNEQGALLNSGKLIKQ